MIIQAGSEAGILLGIPSNATPRTVVAAFEARGVDMRHVEVERFGADSFFLIGHSKQEGWLAQSIWHLAERGFGVLPAPKTPSRSLP